MLLGASRLWHGLLTGLMRAIALARVRLHSCECRVDRGSDQHLHMGLTNDEKKIEALMFKVISSQDGNRGKFGGLVRCERSLSCSDF